MIYGNNIRDEVDKLVGKFESLKKAEYDKFWDSYQDHGNRTHYLMGFTGYGWTNDTFRPKYNITPVGNNNQLFYYSRANCDLVELSENLGVTLDLSRVTRLQYGLSNTYFTRLGVLDLQLVDKNTTHVFANSSMLHTINELILSPSITTYSNWFMGCTALTNITISGTIAADFDIHWSTLLSAASLDSIVKHTSTSHSVHLTLPSTAQATYDSYYGPGKWAQLVEEKAGITFLYS